jgi:hypothetical protein
VAPVDPLMEDLITTLPTGGHASPTPASTTPPPATAGPKPTPTH